MAVKRNVESGNNLPAYSEKELLTFDGKGFMVTIRESAVGKTVASPFCALTETHKDIATTATYKTLIINNLPFIIP
jgi:hypothetical protein